MMTYGQALTQRKIYRGIIFNLKEKDRLLASA